jgi:hypothetical protein
VASIVPFAIDLTADEGTRLTAVLDALGLHWDPTQIFSDEAEAHRMLYAHLNSDQQATYDLLIADGVRWVSPSPIALAEMPAPTLPDVLVDPVPFGGNDTDRARQQVVNVSVLMNNRCESNYADDFHNHRNRST